MQPQSLTSRRIFWDSIMSNFVSKKQLEIHHSQSYQMREVLKRMGCEWDGIARAWIAPDLETLDKCYQVLEEANRVDDSPRTGYYGRCGWGEVNLDEWDKPHGAVPKKPRSIKHTPTQIEAIKICGEGNVERYWRDDIPKESAQILLYGENNWNEIYERLENAGWKSRSVSLIRDVVEHFRKCPPDKAQDEILSNADNALLPSDKNVIFKQSPKEVDGIISTISDSSGEVIALAVSFPYDAIKVNKIKWIDGRKWDSSKKRWIVPVEKAEEIFKTFPNFRRSEKAAEIESLGQIEL
jgi:hypothetical protein